MLYFRFVRGELTFDLLSPIVPAHMLATHQGIRGSIALAAAGGSPEVTNAFRGVCFEIMIFQRQPLSINEKVM
jgi:hypothetical protein